MRFARSVVCCALAASCSLPAMAFDYVFDINPAASSVTLQASAFGLSDSDTSPADGTALVALTPSAAPFSTIRIFGLSVDATQQIDIDLSAGFLGAVSVDGINVGLRINDLLGAAGPAVAVTGNSFNQTGNLIQPIGTLNYVGTGIIGASVGTGTADLTTAPPFDAPLAGTVVDNGTIITLTVPISFSGAFDFNGVAITLNVTGQIVATAPTVIAQPGDLDGNGCVNDSDLGILLASFGTAPGGDIDGDGDTDDSDLGILLANFGVGC